VRPVLDKLELPQVQEVVTLERRELAEHKPPGMAGSLLQNMGRRPLRVSLWGVAIGAKALSFLEKLNQISEAGKPVAFAGDIVADTRIEKVLLERVEAQELAGKPQRYAYVLVLREYLEPVKAASTAPVDAAAAADASKRLGDLLPGLTAGAGFLSGLERFVVPLSHSLDQLQQFNAATGHP
jgi:hypothetical protein